MPATLEPATPADVNAIAALRNAVALDLTTRFGTGAWSGCCTERAVGFDLRSSSVYVVRDRNEIVATLRLATKKPWAIDRSWFTPVERPLYLTSMAVAPAFQRQGIGRQCLADAVEIARVAPVDAIFLDAFDHASAGAGDFYRKCGYREVGRKIYRGVPLIYFERLI